jgi:hypothetical protein
MSHYTPWRHLEESKYRSYSFSTSVLDEGEWLESSHCRALAPGKGPSLSTVQEAGWVPELVWTQMLEEKSFRLCRGSNLDRSVVQSVARHYTDWATRLTLTFNNSVFWSTQCIYMCRISLRINSDCFSNQYWSLDLCNYEMLCFLSGTELNLTHYLDELRHQIDRSRLKIVHYMQSLMSSVKYVINNFRYFTSYNARIATAQNI